MAPAATVEKDSQWRNFLFFLEAASEVGLPVCAENLAWIEKAYCFPHIPMIGMVWRFPH